MQINKNDILNIISKIENRQSDQNVDTKGFTSHKSSEHANGRDTGALKLDVMRNQVLNLQKEVKDIQTEISTRQIQIAFLENLQTGDWQTELKAFLSGRQPGDAGKPQQNIAESGSKQLYVSSLKNELTTLNNDLLTHEVKLENIFSSGMIDHERGDISSAIMKDSGEIHRVFSKIRHQSIQKLIQP